MTGGIRKTTDIAVVNFHVKSVPDGTDKDGSPKFRDLEYISKIIPGDNYNVVDRPARDEDRAQYAGQYAAFKEKREYKPDGLALEVWPPMTTRPAALDTLRARKVVTVEQLSECSDQVTKKVPEGGKLRQMARDYMDRVGQEGPNIALQEENDKLHKTIEAKDRKIKTLEKEVADLMAAASDKPS